MIDGTPADVAMSRGDEGETIPETMDDAPGLVRQTDENVVRENSCARG